MKDRIEEVKAIYLHNEYGDFYDWCQRLRNGQIDENTLLEFILTQICQLFEPKFDESRLLTKVEIINLIKTIYEQEPRWAQHHTQRDMDMEIAKAQDDKTASIKDTECQERMERIFGKIEKNPFQYFKPAWDKADKEYSGDIEIREEKWQAFKKQELGE